MQHAIEWDWMHKWCQSWAAICFRITCELLVRRPKYDQNTTKICECLGRKVPQPIAIYVYRSDKGIEILPRRRTKMCYCKHSWGQTWCISSRIQICETIVGKRHLRNRSMKRMSLCLCFWHHFGYGILSRKHCILSVASSLRGRKKALWLPWPKSAPPRPQLQQ